MVTEIELNIVELFYNDHRICLVKNLSNQELLFYIFAEAETNNLAVRSLAKT
jgi:hypothetical protein